MRRCPACHSENPEDARFCAYCGTALASPAATPEERKLVTILFADVVGSTALAGAVDPERLRGQMARFFEIAREEIERFGGTVEKFIGDAVMAVFGLPAVHEDDPERAARAAVAMRERLQPLVTGGTLPPIRIGLSTGEAVANPQATEKGEFLVTGDVVNLAARLQQHADPGQILVAERSMRALRTVATLRAVPPLAVKGFAEPVPAWDLSGVVPPREREVRATPFIGRNDELDILQGHLRRMQREGRGHAVTILGPAGVGKTRLVQEFRARVADVHALRGRAVPYGTGVPFWSLGEAIREECGIPFGDPLEMARQKVERAAAALEITDAVPALLSILGLGGGGRDLTREQLFNGMRSFFQALARRAPLLIMLEDVHSEEEVTLDFLEHSAEWIREVPLLLFVLSRPELLERRPSWMGGKRSASTLYLDPLGGEESRALALGILGGKPAPEPLLSLILTNAEGNPLFMEELLRTLIERQTLAEESDRWTLTIPLTQVAIPDTIHAVVAARVDALPTTEKQVLQVAAIQGKDFWLGGVHYALTENHIGAAVDALTRKELLIRKARSTLVGEEEFTFRHILIRDVAYSSIPKTHRWPKHVRVAEWMSQTAGDRQAEWADFIAHHWLQVVALQRELGLPDDAAARERAVSNLLLAGDHAAHVYANTTALDHYSRVLELESDPAARFRGLIGRGEVWMFMGQFDRARVDFTAAGDLARQQQEIRWEAVTLDHLGMSFRQQDQIASALQHLEHALTLSRQVGDPALTGRILTHIGFTYFADGKPTDGLRAHEEARPLLETAQDLAGLAGCLHGLGENYMFLGRFGEGLHWLSESAALAEKVGNRSLVGENLYMIARTQQVFGNYTTAHGEVQRSIATLTEIGDVWNLCAALFNATEITVRIGEFGKGLEFGTRAVELARQIEAPRLRHYSLWALGVAHRELEDYHSSWQVDREAAEYAIRIRGNWMPAVLAALALDAIGLGEVKAAEAHIAEARRVLDTSQILMDFPHDVAHAEGRTLLAAGASVRAREMAHRLTAMAEAAGSQHWRTMALLLEADAEAAGGQYPAAAAAYGRAAAEAERRGHLPAVWRALAGLAEAQNALNTAEATDTARRAKEIIDRLAATIPDERLRAVFLQSSKVQRVFALAGA